jgi:N-acetylglucosaminyl-diphospho-decaprenol L-rhamnosyltransferase
MGSVAVVTIAHGRHEHLRRQQSSLASGTSTADHVVVAMADPLIEARAPENGPCHVVSLAADPEALPLAQARNLGARTAIERGAQTLVFLDVDCLAGPHLVAAYAQAVAQSPGTIWSGPVTYLPAGLTEDELAHAAAFDDPHPARPAPGPGEVIRGGDPNLFWSLSFAVHERAWLRSGGFCEDYVGYGAEDTDFAQQAAERGLHFGWVGDARAYHQHHPTQDPPVQHLQDILRNAAVFHGRWGRWPMLGWLRDFEEAGLVRRTERGWAMADDGTVPVAARRREGLPD